MSKRDKVKASEAGAALAGPSMTEEEATGRIRRWHMAGIIPSVGRAGERCDGRDAFLFDQSAPAIAHVLFWVHDHAGIAERAQLAAIWRFLAESRADEGEGVPAIDHVLAEVMAGGQPMLVLTRWGDPNTGELTTGCALRFDDEYARPIEPPQPRFAPLAYVTLDLARHLERFVGVISIATPDLVN